MDFEKISDKAITLRNKAGRVEAIMSEVIEVKVGVHGFQMCSLLERKTLLL